MCLMLISINSRTLGAYSEEQAEHFHQDILDFEHHYQGSYNKNMGSLPSCSSPIFGGPIHESNLQYKHKSQKSTHF